MANHAKQVSTLKAKIELYDIENGNNIEKLKTEDLVKRYDNQQAVLSLCIHSADVSNPAKPFIVYKKWVDLVFVEFFNQGDLEKSMKLPVSILCDRETTNISKSQIGFINFVVKPTFDLLSVFVPEVKQYQENIELNISIFQKKALEEDEAKLIKKSSINKN